MNHTSQTLRFGKIMNHMIEKIEETQANKS